MIIIVRDVLGSSYKVKEIVSDVKGKTFNVLFTAFPYKVVYTV